MAVTGSGPDDDLQIDLKALAGEVWQRRWRILLVTLILCAATYAILLFVPKEYESSASLLVEPRQNIYTSAANDPQSSAASGGVTDDVVVSSQIQLIQSPDTLLRAVRDLKLGGIPEFGEPSGSLLDPIKNLLRKPGTRADPEQIALANLQDKLTVIRQRDSRVVSILVRSKDKDLAARIANAIAAAHVNRRAEQSVDDTAEASQWLQNEIAKLRQQVSASDQAVAEYKIDNDLFNGPNDTSLLQQQLSAITTQLTDTQERKNTALSRARMIRQLLDAGKPIDSVQDVRDSVIIQRLSEDKATLQTQLAELSANLLPSHPDVQAVAAQISEINKQIAAEGRRVADALESEADVESSLEQSLRDDLTGLKALATTATNADVQLQSLERDATAQRNLLETYLSRYSDAASRTDTNAALPDVRVISYAVPALTPATPKVTLILAAVALVSLVVQAGAILFRELSYVPVRLTILNAMTNRAGEEDEAPDEPEPDAAYGSVEAEPGIEQEQAADAQAARPGLIARLRTMLPLGNTEPAPDADTGAAVTGEWGANDPLQPDEGMPEAEPQRAFEPEPAPMPAEPVVPERRYADLAGISAGMIAGREQILMILGLDNEADCAGIAEQLIIAALGSDLSVALVDAGSGTMAGQPGITDLAANRAEFGDVVQASDISGLSEVCWGTLPRLSRQSERAMTLVDALGDIYEVVIVMAGTAGGGSNLQAFSGLDASLVMVAGPEVDATLFDRVTSHAANWGFARQSLLHAPIRDTEVA